MLMDTLQNFPAALLAMFEPPLLSAHFFKLNASMTASPHAFKTASGIHAFGLSFLHAHN
jgi:hypothetical protein